MTCPVAAASERRTIDDALLELAILDVLAERTEIYPSHLAGELRRRAPALPAERVSSVLERMWSERRVARLWHRYLLPEQVATVRARWLAAMDTRRAAFGTLDTRHGAYDEGRAILTVWDGWRVEEWPVTPA